MQKTQISYSELAKRVGDCILFNNHNANNEHWYETIYLQPLLQEKLDELDEENKQWKLKDIEQSKDEAEKAKLTEELNEWDENGERASVLDFEIYQSYHITRGGAEYLLNHTSEVVSYDDALDAYIWHIGHYGTSWDGVYITFTDYSDDNDHNYFDIDEVNYAY